jgi:DNA polymerase III subunit gamma/tau
MSWANEFRPTRFEDVIGQTAAVKQLSGYVLRGKVATNVFIHGPRGLGKTTLIPIYAKALNCRQINEHGSPCGECDNCQRSARYFFEYEVPSKPHKEQVQAWYDAISQTQTPGLVKTLFFDEGQAFKAGAMEVLLKPLHDADPKIVICVATSEPWKLSVAFKSRFLTNLSVEPLTVSESLNLLEGSARRKSISYDIDALALIAKMRRGYAREMIHALQQVYMYKRRVDLKSVRATLDLDQGRHLVAYLRSLAQGDKQRCTTAITMWRASTGEKVSLLRGFLTALYYQDILLQEIAVSPVVDAILDGRDDVIVAFMNHVGVADRGALRPFFVKMMEFWFAATTDLDEGALQMQLALFEEFVGQLSLPKQSPVLVERDARPLSLPYSPTQQERDPTIPYIQFSDIRNIVNSSSFFIQHYGKTFNVLLFVKPHSDINSEERAMAAFGDFCAKFAGAFPEESGAAFVGVPERQASEFVMRVAAYFPGCYDMAELDRRLATRACDTFTCSESVFASAEGSKSLRDHWSFVRELCAGFVDLNESYSENLLELLKVRRAMHRLPQPLSKPQPMFSSLLMPDAIARSCELGMKYLSAFDSRAWSAIGGVWHFEEHTDRKKESFSRRQRLADLSAVRREAGKSDAGLDAEISRLKDKWHAQSAFDRVRSWKSRRWW